MAQKPNTERDNSPPDLTKTERVYDDLRRRIRELELAPGTQLRKNELAVEFGVSRAPISEALAKLANEGLVDIYPQSGSYVAPIRNQDIRESMIIRTALEVETVRRAAQTVNDEQIAQLRENIERQKLALDEDNLPLLDNLDTEFHSIIVSVLDCPRLANELEACRARLDRQRFQSLREALRPDQTLNEHRRIFDAICTRDGEYAAAAMRAHLNYVNIAIERWLDAKGDRALEVA